MVVGKLVANLSHFDYSPSLRCDFDYIKYMRDEFPKDFTFEDGEKLRFRDFIVSIRNGENVKKAYYSLTPTPYKYLSVSNVQNRNIIWDDISHLTEGKGKELENRKLEKGSIIVTRSGSVGRVALFSEADRTVIPSGYLIIISVDESKVKPRFVLNYLASSRVQKYFTILSIGKDQENISQADVRSLPFPSLSLDKQSEILDEVNRLERKINTLARKIEPLQEELGNKFWSMLTE